MSGDLGMGEPLIVGGANVFVLVGFVCAKLSRFRAVSGSLVYVRE